MSPDIPPSSVSHDTIQKGLWTGNFFTGKPTAVLPVWEVMQRTLVGLPISLKSLTDEEFRTLRTTIYTLYGAVLNEDYDRNEKS